MFVERSDLKEHIIIFRSFGPQNETTVQLRLCEPF